MLDIHNEGVWSSRVGIKKKKKNQDKIICTFLVLLHIWIIFVFLHPLIANILGHINEELCSAKEHLEIPTRISRHFVYCSA